LNLVASAEAGKAPAWIILDDLGNLERLTQLPAVITGSRKANSRVVLGIRDRAQLGLRCGTAESERILNQPMTKVFLRTSEPHTAKWISDVIGDVEIEKLVADQDREASWRGRKIFQLERRIEPLDGFRDPGAPGSQRLP